MVFAWTDLLAAAPIAFIVGVGVGLGLASKYRIVRARNPDSQDRDTA